MVHKAGISVLFGIGLLTAACGVGDDDDFKPDPIDPNPNRVTCSSAFAITGSFTAGTPARPVEVPTGCWPVGLWTFSATLDNAAPVLDVDLDGKGDRCGEVPGTVAPTVAASYSFRVNRSPLIDDNGTPANTADDAVVGWDETYQYMGDLSTFHTVKVSEGGSRQCEGTLELVSPDKKSYWILKPSQGDAVIDGFGEFTLFEAAQPY